MKREPFGTRIFQPSDRRACRRISRRLTTGSRDHLSAAGTRRAFKRMFSCRLFENWPRAFGCLP